MATSDTHLPDTIHIDEQGCKADASGQWLLEKEHQSGQHPITSNNSIEVLMCGEDSFKSIAVNLANALSTVDLICWGFDPGMALVRRDSNPAWDPNQTYGAILRRLASKGVKVRLMIWYHRVASVKQQSMPGFTDSVLPTRTFEEIRQASERARGNGDAYQSIPLDQRTDKDLRQDHCIEWWRWAMDKRNKGLIEVRHRDGDKYTIRQSFLSEASQPQGHWNGVPVQKILAEDFGTHHQKTVLIDYHHASAKAVGYVMGLNSLTQYWDTSDHLFNDPKRDLDHGGTTDTYKRVKKAGGDPSTVRVDPLHDYVCRIEGEAL